MVHCIWTSLKARLQRITQGEKDSFNWVFLPGGPGMGSESLSGLTSLLRLPGSMWHLDLPGDGSNTTENDSYYFSHWSSALADVVASLDNVILVAHSTGGMYALATPILQSWLKGLVLMDSAPNSSWQHLFSKYVQQNPIDELNNLHEQYLISPNNELLKKMVLASIPYLFSEAGLTRDLSFLENLPYNHQTCDWSAQNFDNIYQAQWIPEFIPTLIFSGENDHITPLQLFHDATQFRRNNILMKTISQAGHFPWIDNPEAVCLAFSEYCTML
ncbi:alpha/beta fold hydrolase [Legionella fallonii]|uniref:AB hydrolase-1 domain-containing protein n=1 Tax=Legionella fallonii LLAP-10 TaxID=1212491 RepID=A0A098G5P6_9GAMM|nr:alpha/beta hydrolase [Legionella fallonii]CEG57299.1 conserved protein of unknown function [ALPHA/BETA HYDROLASE RELATED] [Legionella fallonii LLAP-10]